MELVRNFINISGLADENDLPAVIKGQLIQYSEVETIFIPDNHPDVKSIFQIMIKVEITNSRSIKTPTGYTVVLDGVKKLKIIYTQNDDSGKAVFLDLQLPYNTYVELPGHIKIDTISVFILDAYFNLIDRRKIYSHLLYMVNVSAASQESANLSITPESVSAKPEINFEVEIPVQNKKAAPTKAPENTLYENEDEENSPEILIDLDAEYL
ncbi:MAG TPA: hypothetical protein VF941_12800 [Clostridia bacterium]